MGIKFWESKKVKEVEPKVKQKIMTPFPVTIYWKDKGESFYKNVIKVIGITLNAKILILSDFTAIHVQMSEVSCMRIEGGYQSWMEKEGIPKNVKIIVQGNVMSL